MVVYLFRVKLNLNKSIFSGFSVINGIGLYHCRKFQAKLGVSNSTKLRNLSARDLKVVERTVLQKVKRFERELFRYDYYNIQRLLNIHSYRGLCHKLGKPVNGQRTHTNASTQFSLFRKRLKLRK